MHLISLFYGIIYASVHYETLQSIRLLAPESLLAIFLLTQTVTELHPLKPFEDRDIVVVTLVSGRKVYVDDYDPDTLSINVQLRSFTNAELGLMKRALRRQNYQGLGLDVITEFLENQATFRLHGALSRYSSPLTRTFQPRVCFDHNTGFRRPLFRIEDKETGGNEGELLVYGLNGQIESVHVER